MVGFPGLDVGLHPSSPEDWSSLSQPTTISRKRGYLAIWRELSLVGQDGSPPVLPIDTERAGGLPQVAQAHASEHVRRPAHSRTVVLRSKSGRKFLMPEVVA